MSTSGYPMRPDSPATADVDQSRFPRPRLLRLSVTDRCNFRCRCCMPPEGMPKISHADLLSVEELGESVAWLTSQVGIERVKLTGGEPLVRKGIERLIAQLVATPGMHEVSMTTNGSLLRKTALVLKAAGLSQVKQIGLLIFTFTTKSSSTTKPRRSSRARSPDL